MSNIININNNKTKYMFLYNIDEDYICSDEVMVNKLKIAIPETKVLNFSLCKKDFDSEEIFQEPGKSIWVPADKYLIAWTICNYEYLLSISFTESDGNMSVDDGLEWWNMHNKEQYIKYL